MQGGIHSYLENHSKDGGFWVGKNYTFDKRYGVVQLITDLDMVRKKVLLLANVYLVMLLGINTGEISDARLVEYHYLYAILVKRRAKTPLLFVRYAKKKENKLFYLTGRRERWNMLETATRKINVRFKNLTRPIKDKRKLT